jgi:hypothetical protein
VMLIFFHVFLHVFFHVFLLYVFFWEMCIAHFNLLIV